LPGFRDVIDGQVGEDVMSGVAAPEGQRTTQDIGRSSAKPIAASQPSGSSSRSTIIGVGIVGALLTALAVGGVIMATGPAPTPVASAAAPVAAVAPASVTAPATVPAPVAAPAPAQAPAAAGDIAQTLARVLGPAQTSQPSASDQCEVGQPQQLAVELSASNSREVGNVVRFSVGSYVSPPIVVTRSPQVVTFPAPPGSRGSAQMATEQRYSRGFTLDGIDGLDSEFGWTSGDLLRSVVNLHWTPRC